MEKRKEKIIILGLILIMIVAVVGVSYAAFSYTDTGDTVNSITSGAITMTYTETSNIINMSGALPTTDKTGTVRLTEGEYFDFTISSNITGNVNINYEISAKDITTSDRKIDGSNIKLYLTKLNSDGSEEALMLPETYSEEANANNYTGRPAGEMSLYTSSMNSSETNNYRLRMYVTEEYNPQGDGGNLQFSVQINVYGKDGDKYVPETVQTILANNELQEEKTNMFNYASNGGYFDMENGPSTNPEYVTNGLFQAEDEDGISYYFRGNVTNNNVQFGEYQSDYYVYYVYNSGYQYFQSLESCQEHYSSCNESNRVKLASAGDKMYWKIIRVNGDGSLRLIYNGTNPTATDSSIDDANFVGMSLYNLEYYNDQKYAGYTYDNGTDSFVKKEVDTWYNNTLGSNQNYDRYVILGRFCSDSSGYKQDTDYDFPDMGDWYFFSSYDRLGQSMTNYAKANAPTLKCPSISESYGGSYRLKAGLITADELVLAGENPGVTTDSYLNPGENGADYWTMTPCDFGDSMVSVWAMSGDYLGIGSGSSNNNYAVRPVINVLTDTGFTSGDGTVSSPYVLG